jgi:subtilisin family serine protease
MSTEDQNKSVVTLNVGVDVDAFIEDMVSGTNHTEFMPNRRVELYNEKPDSLRNVDFVLTRQEAELLKQDPRVLDVRYGTKAENGILLRPSVVDTSKLYSKTTGLDNTHYNWAIPACTSSTNPFSTTDLNFAHQYTLIGTGVDVVIQDTGIEPGHPEWLNLAGTSSRLQQINWPVDSGLSGTYTQGGSFYSDQDGHGTHVAGTAAGRLYGWAKGANIYSMKIFDTNAFGVSASFNMIRAWHNLKSVTSTGYKRPTIVNMSWEYYGTYTTITGGNYRGTPWNGVAPVSAYGMVSTIYNRTGSSAPYTYLHPLRVSSVEADMADAIGDGVILIGAAGNQAHKADIIGGLDYDNSFTSSVDGVRYYHRGSTPGAAANVVCVGGIRYSTLEGKSYFSNCGPRVDVFAPGEAIQSAIPVSSATAGAYGTSDYPTNATYKITKLGGTSMACPQVSGVVACVLEARPSYTPGHVESWIANNATANRVSNTGGGYTDTSSLQGATNLYLKQPFNRSKVFSIVKS